MHLESEPGILIVQWKQLKAKEDLAQLSETNLYFTVILGNQFKHTDEDYNDEYTEKQKIIFIREAEEDIRFIMHNKCNDVLIEEIGEWHLYLNPYFVLNQQSVKVVKLLQHAHFKVRMVIKWFPFSKNFRHSQIKNQILLEQIIQQYPKFTALREEEKESSRNGKVKNEGTNPKIYKNIKKSTKSSIFQRTYKNLKKEKLKQKSRQSSQQKNQEQHPNGSSCHKQ